MKKINLLIKYLNIFLIGFLTLFTISASANITVLAWPGGPAEGAAGRYCLGPPAALEAQPTLSALRQ